MKMIGLVLLTVSLAIGEACLVSSMPICTENEFTYHEHEADSTSYYLCANGILTIFSCPPGGEEVISVCPKDELFSTTENKCVNAEYANCMTCREPSTESSTVTNVSPEITTDGIITTTGSTISVSSNTEPDFSTTGDFSITDSDTTLSNTLTTDDKTDTTLIIYETSTISTTPGIPLPPCPPQPECKANDQNNRLPYPPECQMYVKCKKSSPDEYWMCPDGKEFSPITQWCEFPNIANCTRCGYDGTLPPVEGTETPPIENSTL
ncbi:hypothetical protein B566_EDAN015947, partial [Ephemera danica]